MARSRRTVTRTLVMLMLALTVPVTAFTIFVLVRYALEEQGRYARDAERIAGFVSQIVDKELSNLAALLKGASSSEALQSGDLPTFHREARGLVSGTDNIIVLRDRGERQLLNTSVAFDASLPPAPPILPDELAILDQGRPLVSGIFPSPIDGELRVPVAIPVTIDSAPLVLAITVPAQYFHDVISPAAPPGWVVTLGDARGIVVARSLDNETYAGQPALPAYLELANGASGSFRITGFGGAQLLSGYARSGFSNWLTGANIPVNIVEAPLWGSLAAIAMVALAAAAIATAIGAAFIRRFRSAAQTLLTEARRGQVPVPSSPPDTGLEEFDQAIEALTTARARRGEAERSLRDRTQELEVVLDTAPAAVWFTYDPAVKRVKSNAYATRILRMAPDSDLSIASGQLTHLTVFKDGAPCPMDELPLDRAFRGEHLRDEEYVFRFDDGTEITLLTSAEPLRDPSGQITGSVAIGIDISERKRNDEHQKLLINELNHRVKNTLTTVQSIARRSLRTANSLPDAERALGDRLVAIARAYDVLTREHWQGADVGTMIENTVGGYAQSGRVTFEGPDFWLSPSNSVTFSLIVHELAVNATKHGALSGDDGQVQANWTVEREADADVLTLTWRESGGPPVKPPERTGFGSDLLRRLSDSGGSQHRMDFDPAGLICTFSLRQPHAAAPDAAPQLILRR